MRNTQRAKLAAEGVKTGYGARVVLSEVAFELRPGEVMALLGPNGAGKSTLLKSAAGQLALQGGSIYLEGKDLRTYSGRERAACMALLFTERREPEFATAREVVEAGRYPYTGRFGTLREPDHKAVARAMSYVRTEELQERPFSELSDGQRQRVLLARALAQEPRLILLDEPTAFLDLRHKIELLSLLRNLATREGLAVFLSLHEPDLALKCADRVLLVADGKVLPPAAPEEALSEDNMRRIYGLGSAYDALSGSAELPTLGRAERRPPLGPGGGGGGGAAGAAYPFTGGFGARVYPLRRAYSAPRIRIIRLRLGLPQRSLRQRLTKRSRRRSCGKREPSLKRQSVSFGPNRRSGAAMRLFLNCGRGRKRRGYWSGNKTISAYCFSRTGEARTCSERQR